MVKEKYGAKIKEILFLLAISVVLTLIVEGLNRRSVFGGFVFLYKSPLFFVYSALFIGATLSLAYLSRRRIAFLSFISCVWIGLSVVNCVLQSFRNTPIAAIDFKLLFSVFSIIDTYLKPWEIVLCLGAIIVTLTLLGFGFAKLPKTERELKWSAIVVLAAFLAVSVFSNIVSTFFVDNSDFRYLFSAYRKYGFAYSFSTSIVDRGIDEPEDYSADKVVEIVEELEEDSEPSPSPEPDTPRVPEDVNVVFVQLESFFDVSTVLGSAYSSDPTPNFNALMEKYSGGMLYVPTVGAGTANTEFEVLSGMSIDHFGVGEYPYATIMKKTSAETACYILKDLGYTTHAIHNHYGDFYDRHEVYPMLGFDTFTSLEYMKNARINPIGWAEDAVLTEEILQALDSTEDKDFVFAISVQAHGKYPREEIEYEKHVSLESAFIDEENSIAFEYYINQLYETDAFVGDLVKALEKRSEPTMVVLYGDHLPNFALEAEGIECGDLFATEYVIWDNFGLEKKDEDLFSYQLFAAAMDRMDIHEGILTDLHQQERHSEDYQEKLQLVEYDMLYGEAAALEGDLYEPTEMKMGSGEFTIRSVSASGNHLFITGRGFTPFSVISIDGRERETVYVNSATVMVETDITGPMEISVLQMSGNGAVLSRTESFTYGRKPLTPAVTPRPGSAEELD